MNDNQQQNLNVASLEPLTESPDAEVRRAVAAINAWQRMPLQGGAAVPRTSFAGAVDATGISVAAWREQRKDFERRQADLAGITREVQQARQARRDAAEQAPLPEVSTRSADGFGFKYRIAAEQAPPPEVAAPLPATPVPQVTGKIRRQVRPDFVDD